MTDTTTPISGDLISETPENPIERLKKAAAEKRKGKAPTPAESPAESASTTAGSSAGGPIDEALSPAANDELAKLAARRGKTTTAAQSSLPTNGSASSSEATGPDGDEVPAEIPGLTDGTGAGSGSLYERRQAELAAARTRPGGKVTKKGGGRGKAKAAAKPLTEKQLAAEAARKEKEEARKAKEREKAAAAKAKKKESAGATKKKEQAEARKKREEERREKLKEQADAKRKERALRLASIPALAKAGAALKAAFAEDYALAGPKTDKNPAGVGMRRAKADRGDFAAGYMMALQRIKKQAKEAGDSKLEAATMV